MNLFFGINTVIEGKIIEMNLIKYLSIKGIKQGVGVVYKYKLDNLILRIMKPFFQRKPLKDIIVIESHNDFDCNGGAFYEYLIQNGYNTRYKIVWLVKHPEYVPQELPLNVSWVPLYKPSLKKNYYRLMARWFTFDMDARAKCRDDQVSVFFDHGGVTLKNVIPFYKGVSDRVDYILSPSDNYAPIICKQFSISYPNVKILNFGYPSNDIYFNEKSNEIAKITNKKYKKIILWMSTFRILKGKNRIDSMLELPYGIPLIDKEEELFAIQNILERQNVLLVIKIHPFQEESSYARLRNFKSDNIILLDASDVKKYQIDNYRLLNSVDAMISDYSSIIYSFLLKDCPVAFVLNDMKDYKPGIIVDDLDKYIFGDKIFTFNDLGNFIDKCANDVDEYKKKRRELSNFIYQHHDGGACKRIVEFLKL